MNYVKFEILGYDKNNIKVLDKSVDFIIETEEELNVIGLALDRVIKKDYHKGACVAYDRGNNIIKVFRDCM